MRDLPSFKSKLFMIDTSMLSIMYNSLVYSDAKRIAISKLKINLKNYCLILLLNKNIRQYLWDIIYEMFNKIYIEAYIDLKDIEKQILPYEEKVEKKADIVFDSLYKHGIQENRIGKALNNVYVKVESEAKEKNIETMLNGSDIFFLCSSHINSASDHKARQGKIYVDENWESKVSDEKKRENIGFFIKNHDVKTLQWVVGAPVYMTTRPNCKHYFVPVSTDEVLTSSANAMLRKRGMYIDNEVMSVAKRSAKTYENRLKKEKALYRIAPCKKLSAVIKNDKKLVRKRKKIR